MPARHHHDQHRTLQCDHGRRRQAIVQSVLGDVFQGRLAAGQHLVTQELAERFGVSHTPIREALIVLEGMGVLDLVPNRGAVVRRVSGRDIREICQVRRILECEAVERACGRIDVAALEALRAELERMTDVPARAAGRFISRYIARARDVDSRLHDLIAGSCGNAFLGQELNRLKVLFRAFRDVSWELEGARNDFGRLAEEAREHLEIVEALLVSNARGAARAMSRHIRSGMRYWSRSLPAGAGGNGAGPAHDGSANGNGRTANGRGRTARKNGRSTPRAARNGNGRR